MRRNRRHTEVDTPNPECVCKLHACIMNVLLQEDKELVAAAATQLVADMANTPAVCNVMWPHSTLKGVVWVYCTSGCVLFSMCIQQSATVSLSMTILRSRHRTVRMLDIAELDLDFAISTA